ncbi:hypothetical protein [Anabaena sp. UHCC 0451]|uniref:hypothetical protein n=1 Tax=Anabaena sp. UHCC 0451 TaxID=2055235 RepID=UPI002B20F123|nr:hypothetical protein [Anabaena sp. UHCC 0451]MEA5577516.1 hypothetical protein [Anabaena sp. UHCC 0451]
MNTSIELPSGKIINIARFIALIPNNNIHSNYQLILEGYPHPIDLESSDAQNLKIILQSKLDQDTPLATHQSTWNQQEQLQKNQKAMAILAQLMEQDNNMSDEESRERQEIFESFKKRMDAERPQGQKLYSEV